MEKNGKKLISIIVCTRNEEKHIERCLMSLSTQRGLDGEIEIFVIDGMSTDKTRSIIASIQNDDARIILLDNPDVVKTVAVNIGFRRASGEYIAICDAHSIYDKRYLSECIKILEGRSDVWCSGGPIESLGEGNFGKANSLAMTNTIGIGNAKHRFPDYEGYAEMACFPVFRRNVLETVGYYDEKFIINHDDEYCYRLRKAGGKVYLSPKAKSFYFVRDTPSGLFKQYFSYGYWQIAFLLKHKIPISLRQLVPSIFFLTTMVFLLISVIFNFPFLGIIIPLIYLGIILIMTVPVILNEGVRVGIHFPLAVFLLHFSYALGFFKGIADFILLKRIRIKD